jgi:Uma2 family endonuclease
MTQARAKPLTLQAFLELPETKPASEYIDGQVIQKPIPKDGVHPLGVDSSATGIFPY